LQDIGVGARPALAVSPTRRSGRMIRPFETKAGCLDRADRTELPAPGACDARARALIAGKIDPAP
jgi:hypothetical protein